MKPAFNELEDRRRVAVFVDGEKFELPDGANLAASLLAAGVTVFRHTSVTGKPRAPFCMMGACFDCMVEIDGVSRQACMIEVAKGLKISRQKNLDVDDAAS